MEVEWKKPSRVAISEADRRQIRDSRRGQDGLKRDLDQRGQIARLHPVHFEDFKERKGTDESNTVSQPRGNLAGRMFVHWDKYIPARGCGTECTGSMVVL